MVLKLLIAGAVAAAARRSSDTPFAQQRVTTVFKRAHDLKMRDAPIEPSWIIDGSPVARAADHVRSADDSSFSAQWDCTAGTFRWYFHWDETVVILEGEVHITAEDGSSYTLRTGDMGYFAARTWATWHIDDYVRKAAFIRRPFPSPIAALYRLKNAFRQNKTF
ncbi:cupin domain-containing protein [Shinella zoogloeoides]|uniref:cupin domain-containing protein n=1 Tax=Shinella zoogloeoides TaxID=352475 RepID=UPI00273E0D5C|nr:cupin domain-containing protein [Shinella zoogloeoides]WLR95237.1 cupin domain-containing protein [Shinella zoogloeoides]